MVGGIEAMLHSNEADAQEDFMEATGFLLGKTPTAWAADARSAPGERRCASMARSLFSAPPAKAVMSKIRPTGPRLRPTQVSLVAMLGESLMA